MPRKHRKLAIQYETKIDRELNKNGRYKLRPSLRTVVLKWATTVALGLLILATVVFSKMSVISLSERMNDDNVTDTDVSKLFVMLQLIGVVPHVICFIRALFKAAFRSDIPWPKRRALIAVGHFLHFLSFSITESHFSDN